jgi:predicted metalloprotease with PDZ domain
MSTAAAEPFPLIYRVRPHCPDAHLFAVELLIGQTGRRRFVMPAWCPGSYLIRDFSRHIVRIEANDADGRMLGLVKTDKQTWELDPGTEAVLPFAVRYEVYAWDQSVRSARLDRRHGFFNGPSLFLSAEGLTTRPLRIELLPPDGDWGRDWQLATSLRPLGPVPLGFGFYMAEDYADLIDHPVLMGLFDRVSFQVRGVSHALVLSGRHHCDLPRLGRDLERICEQHAALFGELPLDRYLFLTTVRGEGYGGLEHRFSSALLASRDDLPPMGASSEAPCEGYRRFLGLCSHEYFHLWHVTRIRPAALVAGTLAAEVHTRLLWVFEGLTSYYDDLALVRGGCIDVSAYLHLLAQTITRVLHTPGRLVQTLAESSFDAWTKFYRQDENGPNAVVSYYAKGALVAFALDLTLRRDTGGRVSLDDLMRVLWLHYGQTGIGVPERGLEALAAELSGLDLGEFFALAVDGTADLDLGPLLATVGVAMRLRPSIGPKDLGGCVERFAPAPCPVTLGVRLRPGARDALIENVFTGGAGEGAGLAPGDQVIAVDGLRATTENLERLVSTATVGTPLSLLVFRGDELLELTASPCPAPADTCELMLDPEAGAAALAVRAAWLAGRF